MRTHTPSMCVHVESMRTHTHPKSLTQKHKNTVEQNLKANILACLKNDKTRKT